MGALCAFIQRPIGRDCMCESPSIVPPRLQIAPDRRACTSGTRGAFWFPCTKLESAEDHIDRFLMAAELVGLDRRTDLVVMKIAAAICLWQRSAVRTSVLASG